jgi:hypothetical protein
LVPVVVFGAFPTVVLLVVAFEVEVVLGTKAPLFQLEPKLRLLNLNLRVRHARIPVRYLAFTLSQPSVLLLNLLGAKATVA